MTISQNLSQAIQAGNSISCNNNGYHADNSYTRRFDLDGDHAITSPFEVTSVSFGVEFSLPGTLIPPTQPLSSRLHAIPEDDPLTRANLTQIAQEDFDLPAGDLFMWQVMINATVTNPLADDLVVEVFSPNGQAQGHVFFIGSNHPGQIAPSYIASAGCGLTAITDLAAIGFGGMHTLINVSGNENPVQVTDASWGRVKSHYRQHGKTGRQGRLVVYSMRPPLRKRGWSPSLGQGVSTRRRGVHPILGQI